ncbi:hypothetical protein COOONC_05420 [Cooperia oncophora]
MDFCWKADPAKRPTAATLVGYLRGRTRKRAKDQVKPKSRGKKSLSAESDKISLNKQIDDVAGLIKNCEKARGK